MKGFVIFTDLEKYSSLDDNDLKIYYDRVVPEVYEKLKNYKTVSLVWNTWGDAIVAVFNDGETAVNMALEYRDIFKNFNFEEHGIMQLRPRIAGHFGEFDVLFDRVSGKINMHGSNVNLAARIEPVVTPGEIFVSKDFKHEIGENDHVKFDDMGVIKLPKDAGQVQAYRLRRGSDRPMAPVGGAHEPSAQGGQGRRCGFKK